jgi:hypothetical protein
VSRTIAIVGGTGPEGTGLARRWARAGESIIIGSRDAERARQVAARLAAQAGAAADISGLENAAAVAAADIVVLTVPFAGQAATLKHVKKSFKPGAILIDATVPLAAEIGGRASRTLGVWQGSAAQQAAEMVPKGVSVVAAFHNLSAHLLEGDAAIECDVIVCADDEAARAAASELAEKIPGVRALNGGPLENARIVEQMTALLITLNVKYGVTHAGLRITGLPKKPAGS